LKSKGERNRRRISNLRKSPKYTVCVGESEPILNFAFSI